MTTPPPRPTAGSLDERLARGKALRHQSPRSAHARWHPPADRPDPLVLLEQTSEGRIAELVPLR